MVVGIKQEHHKKKDFFLFDYTQIEEVSFVSERMHGDEYSLSGTSFLCKKPIYLNILPGFEHFTKHTMGSFAYGMQNAINDPFCKYFLNEKNFIQCNEIDNKLKWFANFEKQIEDKNFCLTKSTKTEILFDWFRFFDDEQISILFRIRYNNIFLWNPEFIIKQFKCLLHTFPNIEEVVFPLNESVLEFAKAFPKTTCIVLYNPKTLHESWNEVIEKFKKQKNIEFEFLD